MPLRKGRMFLGYCWLLSVHYWMYIQQSLITSLKISWTGIVFFRLSSTFIGVSKVKRLLFVLCPRAVDMSSFNSTYLATCVSLCYHGYRSPMCIPALMTPLPTSCRVSPQRPASVRWATQSASPCSASGSQSLVEPLQGFPPPSLADTALDLGVHQRLCLWSNCTRQELLISISQE